jgi:hypothetical protein
LTVLFIVAHHEPWFDEAQAWLLARDNSLFDLLFRRLHYEGSPGLWHVMLWILVRLGLPFRSMSYFSALLASISAGLFLFFAPFPVWLRTLFVFGYYPAYQYAVVARSYGLNLLLIIVTATWYSTRDCRPVRYCLTLAALANANVFGFLVSSALFVDFVLLARRSRVVLTRRHLVSSCIFAIGGLLSVVQALPARDVAFPPYHKITLNSIAVGALRQSARGFVEVPWPAYNNWSFLVTSQHEVHWQAIRLMIGVLLSVGAVVVGCSVAARAKNLAVTTSALGAPFAFQVLKYYAPWHAGLLYLSWVFSLWISWHVLVKLSPWGRRAVVLATTLVFATHAYDALAAWRLELRFPYSGASQAAVFLKGYLAATPNLRMACVGDRSLAVQPYFTRNICANYYDGAPRPSYYDWKIGQSYASRPDDLYVSDLLRRGQYQALLISEYDLSRSRTEAAERAGGYCLLRRFEGEMIWKDYFYMPDNLIVVEKCAAL